MAVGDELLRTSRILAEKRQTAINQDIAIETAKLTNIWQERANTHLIESEFQEEGGFGFADRQKEWYEDNVSKFLDNIRDDRVKAKFQQLVQSHKTAFSNRADTISLQKIKDNQINTLEGNLSDSAGLVFSTSLDKLDDVFDNDVLPPIKLQMESFAPEVLDAARPKIETIYRSYIDRKTQNLESLHTQRLLTLDEYKAGLKELRNDINTGERFKGAFSPTTLRQINNSLLDAEQTADVRLANLQKQNIKNDFDGYKMQRQQGLPKNETFEKLVRNFAAEDASFQPLLDEIDILNDSEIFWAAKKQGDLGLMAQEVNRVVKEAENTDAFGSDFEFKQKQASTLNAEFTKARLSFVKNSAEFFKRNAELKLLKTSGQQTGDFTGYINKLVELSVNQGADIGTVEFLDNTALTNIATQLQDASADKVELIADELFKKFNIRIGQHNNAYNNVVSQIINNQAEIGIDSDKAIMLQYAGTAQFNPLFEATKIKTSESGKILPAGMTLEKVKKAVKTKLDKHLDTIRAQRPENVSAIIAAYTDLGTKVAIQALNDPSSGADSIGKAADVAENLIFKTQYDLIDKQSSDILVRYPKNRDVPGAYLEPVLSNPGFKRVMLNEVLRRGGTNLRLVGDINDLVDMNSYPKSLRENFTLESLLENAKVYTSPDGQGVTMYGSFKGTLLPLRFVGIGSATLTFDELETLKR